MDTNTEVVTKTTTKKAGRKLNLKATAKAKGKKLTKAQIAANLEAAKPVKGKPHAKNKGAQLQQERAEREYAKLWNPADNKKLCLKTDLAPHKADYDNQLSMKHFGLALIGISQATSSYLKHRVGVWGMRRLLEKQIVTLVKGKTDLYAIDRKAADERYGKFIQDLPIAAAKAGKK